MEESLPFLFDSPPIGGLLRQVPEDFEVTEIPLYEPGGDGEHLYLWIEKRELSTPELIDRIARQLGIRSHEIGCAGRKDRWAVTRQFLSVPARHCPEPQQLETEQVRVLSAKRHRNKLKTGHLKGNRFQIRVKQTSPSALDIAQRLAESIRQRGVLNFFGEQRFGTSDQTDADGFRLLRGEVTRRLKPDALRFTLSAAQSRLFNDWVVRRLNGQTVDRVLTGDVMQVVASGGCFVAEDRDVEQARFEQRETAITGPMFGPSMRCPQGEAAAIEQALLADNGLTPEAFERFEKLTQGTRRPLWLWPEDLTVAEIPDGLEFHFTLPAGAYATVVLREFLRT